MLLVNNLLLIVFDVVSSRADEFYFLFPKWLLYVLNMVFFVLFFFQFLLFFFFTLNELRSKISDPIKARPFLPIVFIICELVTISSFLTGAVFSIGPKGYEKGPLYNILYLGSAFYLILAICLLFHFKNRIKGGRFFAVLAYNLILITGLIIRYLLPQYIIMDLFYLVAIIVIFLSFEDPNFYLTEYGVFNVQSLEQLLKEREGIRSYYILSFIIRNYSEQREIYSRRQMDICTTKIAYYLRSNYRSMTVFYVRSGRFVLYSDKEFDMDKVRNEILERFKKPWTTKELELFFDIAFVRLLATPENNTFDNVMNSLASSLRSGEFIENADLIIDSNELESFERQRTVKRALDHAIEQDQVEVFFQPLVDAKTRKTVGAEALARIREEGGKLIPPGEFIPIAEQNGSINRMGEQVYEKTCRFLHDHDLKTMGLSWVNVNVSPLQCIHHDLTDRFLSILDNYGLSPDLIHLEITEESMIDYELLENQLFIMKDLGFLFVLDDYGSGYSNVSRIKRCPFINVKLDMSVVRDHCNKPDGILPALVQAFKQMNFKVTAEGIETEEMADMLSEMGCDFLQGYLYSKPLPMKEFLKKYSVKTN